MALRRELIYDGAEGVQGGPFPLVSIAKEVMPYQQPVVAFF
jgi:hypothetical protein